ncbi:hypothetical protein CYMTET_46233 [Cymbomonas tetramitiformis]|uniref:Uncharacterized protein n=1 Tax=Cymbomonas tetramitiformis TaxID=36881 RepID=A0AAE0BY36_9CHLO|nr:hypothetical protein CYMTET_46233 [Cymbomonas tetramitiformis]
MGSSKGCGASSSREKRPAPSPTDNPSSALRRGSKSVPFSSAVSGTDIASAKVLDAGAAKVLDADGVKLNVLQALGQRSHTRRDKEALDALHRVFTVANAVAHVTAARRATAASGHTVDDKVSFEAKHRQDIRILVCILLEATVQCAAAGPEMRARLLCLLQCADRML